VCFSSAALIFSSAYSFATQCPSNGTAETSLPEETLDCAYQPPDGCETLHRKRFLPYLGEAPYPTVLMLPPDVFKLEYGDRGVPSELWATEDLRDVGFMVFQVDHRLAPPNKLPNQTSDGHAPDQTDDLKRQILAALADPQCNGSIYLVGGSAGGTLALWCALDAASTVAGWNEAARAHIKAVVSLSGPTDFCDWRNPGNVPDLMQFENDLDNYVGLPDQTDCDHDPDQKLNHASPAWLVTNGATSSPPPIRLYATNGDSVPYSQEDDMWMALTTQFPALDIFEYRMSYLYTDKNHHAYTYWHSVNDDPIGGNECVSEQVIEFLQANP
jgi:pimeloyl-ACP methyl ester carboxylesterase